MALVVDFFCHGGGASVGYWLAGFDVVGVDIEPQVHYPFPFIQADALRVELGELAAGHDVVVVHGSPPCQLWSAATSDAAREHHVDLLTPFRERCRAWVADGAAAAWIIENVPGAPLPAAVTVCGGGLGLGVRRHRLFESSLPLWGMPCANHGGVITVVGDHGGASRGADYVTAAAGREAMGIPWLPWPALTQSVPPAYTEFLGGQIAAHLDVAPISGRHVEQLSPRCRCGTPVERAATGRWRLYCGQRCRQANWRERRRQSAGPGVGGTRPGPPVGV